MLGSKHRRHKVTDIVIVGDQDTVFSEVTLSNQYHSEHHHHHHLVVQLQQPDNNDDDDDDDQYFHKQCLAQAVAMPWFEADEEYRRNRCERNNKTNKTNHGKAPSLVVLSSTNSSQQTTLPQQPTRDWYANIHNDMNNNNNDQENTFLEIHFPAATQEKEEEEEEQDPNNNNNNASAAAASQQEDMGRLLDASQHSSKSVFFRLDLESDHTRQESLLGAYAALTSLAEANSFVAQMNYYSSSDDSSCSSSSSYTSYSSSSTFFFDEDDDDEDDDEEEEGSLDDEDLQPVRKRSNNTPETSYVLLESDEESVFTR